MEEVSDCVVCVRVAPPTSSVDCVDCESLTPTQGATQQSVGVKKKGKKVGGKIAFSGIPNKWAQNQKCSPTKGNKIRSGSLTLAFSGAHKRAKMLRHPCILGDPQTKGDKIRSGYLTPAFSGAQKRAEMLRHPCILRVFSKGDKIKSGCIGSKDKTLDVQSKRIPPKNFHKNDVFASKNTLKTPPTYHLKKRGGVPKPPRYRISQNPPPPCSSS